MTALELSKAIGQTVALEARGLTFLCEIKDARTSYGRVQFLITPKMGGTGQVWVDYDSVMPVTGAINQEHLDKPGRVAHVPPPIGQIRKLDTQGFYKPGHYQGTPTALALAAVGPRPVGTITKANQR